MSWVSFLSNSKPIESVYSEPPPLTDVRLHEVRLHQDGPRLSLRIELGSYPLDPPQHWLSAKCNRVQITLMVIGVTNLSLGGWSTDNVGDIEFGRDGHGLTLSLLRSQMQLACNGDFLEVEKLSAYRSSD